MRKLCGALQQHEMSSVRTDLNHAVLSRRHGCWETKLSEPFAMRNWNTRRAYARYAISARNPSFQRERSFTVFTIIGGALSRMAFPPIRFSRQLFRSKTVV